MKARGVHLHYSYQAEAQRASELGHPLFELLQAVRAHGSIQHAASALGASYRHVWGRLKQWEQALGEPLIAWAQGQPARLTPFAERLLWSEARARARLAPQIEALRAELERVLAEALDGAQPLLTLWASQELALARLRGLAAGQGLHLDLQVTGSAEALRALGEGRCLVAGFHVPPPAAAAPADLARLRTLLRPARHRLIGGLRRTQGLMAARGNPLGLQRLADVPARGARFVQRPPGSGTRALTERLCATEGVAPAAWAACAGLTEGSHLAVAAAVASGAGDAGVGTEAAARAFGLHFVPLLEEHYWLACAAAQLEHPAVRLLRAVLASPAWRDALADLPGCRPHHGGEPLPLAQALPWQAHGPSKGP